jgi:hypothetical protein
MTLGSRARPPTLDGPRPGPGRRGRYGWWRRSWPTRGTRAGRCGTDSGPTSTWSTGATPGWGISRCSGGTCPRAGSSPASPRIRRWSARPTSSPPRTLPPCGPVGLAVRRYLLAGLLACDQCGRRRESAWSNGKPGYRCRYGHTSATRPNPGRPKNAYVREDQILPHLAAIAILLACDDQARGGDSVQLTTPYSSSKPTGSRDPADRNSACESSGAAARASVPGHPVRTSQLLPCSCPRRIWARHPRTRSFASRYCHDHPPPRHDLRPAVPRIVIDLGYAGTYRHVTCPPVRGVHAHCRLRWRPGITRGSPAAG